MKKFDYIFFDCMETLIDLHKLPTIRDYAAWAYDGSGVEGFWADFDEFFRFYLLAKQDLSSRLPENADYEMRGRFLHIVKLSLTDMPYGLMEATAGILYENYWRHYKAGSYVREDVIQTLPKLRKQFKMGVVSNFMVMDGIEELLGLHEIRECFEFVVTSVAVGWRKPHPIIYKKALEYADVAPERVLFVGDDFVNDYIAPSELGITPFYLDRYDRHPELGNRVTSFNELQEILLGI